MSQGFGARIAQVRRLLGVAMQRDFSQSDLAEAIGAARLGTVSRWENEEMRPRRKWLEAIADLCQKWGIPGVTPGWLDYAEGQGPPTFGKPAENGADGPKRTVRTAKKGEQLQRSVQKSKPKRAADGKGRR